MSEPKRYDLITTVSAGRFSQSDLVESKDGNLVSYDDYAHIKAQVERLTKAGDAMADECSNFQGAWPLIKDWHAAKGVQS